MNHPLCWYCYHHILPESLHEPKDIPRGQFHKPTAYRDCANEFRKVRRQQPQLQYARRE